MINASFTHVSGTAIRGTTIANGPGKVHTVEHLLAVCSGLCIDNLEIEINNNEPPIMDGSAKPFADVLLEAGIIEQNAERRYMTFKEPAHYKFGSAEYFAYPADELSIECTVGYEHPLLREQKISLIINSDNFLKEIAPARTFCFDYEIEALKSKGLAKGGDFSNAIVVGLNGIHNTDPLRFPDEFVRHKLLDLLGDLYLLGRPLKARIVAVKCGHNHNIEFARELANVGQ